ncbi:MAG: hypothetical protein KDK99_02385 [Verrucomicrobiales bacterium]|nr:hypothetical protein [Verrucomicrobiales bacterium]
MQIRLDKARKLIDELEKTLNATAKDTQAVRERLGQWLTTGEKSLRKKGAAALSTARKRADRLSGALGELEKHLAKTLEKSLAAKPADTPPKKSPAKKSAQKSPKKAPASKAAAKKRTAKKAGSKRAASK